MKIKSDNNRLILKMAMGYMSIPTLFFIASLPFNFSIKTTLILLTLIYFIRYNKIINDIEIPDSEINTKMISIYLLLIFLSYYSLFVHGTFVSDWIKHMHILNCLYSNPLNPTLSDFNLPEFRLVYYYGMYLPAAYVKNLLPFLDLKALFFVWNFLGLCLVSLLFPVACEKAFHAKLNYGIFFIIILLFSGTDYWNMAMSTGRSYVGHAAWFQPYFASMDGMIVLWQWVPSQLVVAMLGVAVLLTHSDDVRKFPMFLISIFSLTSSVWCWIGIIPLMVALFWRKLLNVGKMELAISALSAIAILLFYSTKISKDSLIINPSLFKPGGIEQYLFFLFLELVPFFIIFSVSWKEHEHIPQVVVFSIATIILLPLVAYGQANDLYMRGILPSYFVVLLFGATIIQKHIKSSISTKILIFILFLIIFPCFLNEFLYGIWANCPLEYPMNIDQIMQYAGK